MNCTGRLVDGRPCPARARHGTEPPRCGRHPYAEGERSEHPKKDAALSTFAEQGNVTAACRAAGIGRTTWYDWVNEDPEFARALAHAEEEAADSLEAAARQRALNGSDVMTIFLLKGLRPEKFRDGPRTIVQAAAGFDEHGQPTAGVQISEQGMSLVERFAAYQAEHRDAIEAEATG